MSHKSLVVITSQLITFLSPAQLRTRRDTAKPLRVMHPKSLPKKVKLGYSVIVMIRPANMDRYRARGDDPS